jgi:hypothetical protein
MNATGYDRLTKDPKTGQMSSGNTRSHRKEERNKNMRVFLREFYRDENSVIRLP